MIQRIVRECELSQINGKPLHNQYVDFDDKECVFCHAFNVAYQRGKTETEKRVRELHKPWHYKSGEISDICSHCHDELYPCPTIKALDGEQE